MLATDKASANDSAVVASWSELAEIEPLWDEKMPLGQVADLGLTCKDFFLTSWGEK